MHDMIHQVFADGIELRQRCAGELAAPLAAAAECMAACLQGGGKILACGNGGSAADAQHFAAELVNRFEMERPGLASIALTTDSSILTSVANDYAYEYVFARQVEALGAKGDVLLAISTSGSSPNVLQAVQAATQMGIHVVALTGKDGGKLATHPGTSTLLNIPHAVTARVQEMHITCLHILCSLIDHQLYGAAA